MEVLFHSKELLSSLKLCAAAGFSWRHFAGRELSRLNKNLIRKADSRVEVPKGRWKEKDMSLPEKIEKVIGQLSFLSSVPLRAHLRVAPSVSVGMVLFSDPPRVLTRLFSVGL